jgi:membrane associated rhomboid family serine protease
MVILFIFGSMLENMIGSFLFATAYLLSGLAGAWGFLALSGLSTIPVVGASGAISGIMALYAVCERRPRVRFFYFISPLRDFFGFVYLPTWLIFPICFLPDLASYLSHPHDGGGVAYAAHIGGVGLGTLMGLYLRKFSKLDWAPVSLKSEIK